MSLSAFHGGQFWHGIGVEFDDLSRRKNVVNADVLDAWFAPAPGVLEALVDMGEWGVRTSPPTHAEGLECAIARALDVPPESVLAGPGSSALMYLVWTAFLAANPRVFVAEPTYGEYAHLAEHVLQGTVIRHTVHREDGFRLDPAGWSNELRASGASVAVVVNPNNPTGTVSDLHAMLAEISPSTTVWVDEAYIDYVDSPSMARRAASLPNVWVLKSMSKCYALSGMRAAYLVSHPANIARIRRHAPPWWVSLPAQVGAIAALQCREYYADKWAETDFLRRELETQLRRTGVQILASVANWVLLQLPPGYSAAAITSALASQQIHVRNAGASAPSLGDNCLRIAVRSAEEQDLLMDRFRSVLASEVQPRKIATPRLSGR